MAHAASDEREYTLRDGTRVRLRPIAPTDKERLATALEQLSTRSRHRRFLGGVSSLAGDALRYLTEVDQVNHIAWVAVDPSLPEQPLRGVARCVRIAGEPRVAELAVLVSDELQNRGLGSLLITIVAAAAAAHGIETLRATVLRENAPVVAALSELGARGTVEDGVVVADVPLVEAAALAAAWDDSVRRS